MGEELGTVYKAGTEWETQLSKEESSDEQGCLHPREQCDSLGQGRAMQ